MQAFEDKQYNRAEAQAANRLFKQAVHMSSSDDSSDDDAATALDQAAVDELREAGNASFKAKDTVEAARSWSKAAAMLKAAGKPDAKLLSNIAAACVEIKFRAPRISHRRDVPVTAAARWRGGFHDLTHC